MHAISVEGHVSVRDPYFLFLCGHVLSKNFSHLGYWDIACARFPKPAGVSKTAPPRLSHRTLLRRPSNSLTDTNWTRR